MNKFFIAAILCATAAGANAQSLWMADGWNAFVRGNFTSAGSDTEGRVAVGGNLDVSSYAVGLQLPSNFSGDSLYVQGDFKFLGGSVYHGDVRTLDTTPTTANLTISNGSSIKITPAPFWIPTVFTELIGRSGYWGHLGQNGTTNFQFNGFTLNGGTGTTRIFNINGDDLSVANNFTINLPAGVTALVNITGKNPKFKNAGFNLQGGITKEKVLLNFWEANTVELSGVGIFGNLLAPQADVSFASGQINGQVVANSYSGQGQINIGNFDGVTPVPEPASLVAFGVGLVALVKHKRK